MTYVKVLRRNIGQNPQSISRQRFHVTPSSERKIFFNAMFTINNSYRANVSRDIESLQANNATEVESVVHIAVQGNYGMLSRLAPPT